MEEINFLFRLLLDEDFGEPRTKRCLEALDNFEGCVSHYRLFATRGVYHYDTASFLRQLRIVDVFHPFARNSLGHLLVIASPAGVSE